MDKSVIREHERVAFLEEESYDTVSAYLNENAQDLGPDDKTSYFFVLPDVNVSVAVTSNKAVLKYKGGQLGKGVGFEEMEIQLANTEEAEKTVRVLEALTELEPQRSQQIRHNYMLDSIELALKYTETWGFHIEFEKLYHANDEELEVAAHRADEEITRVAGRLGIQLATNEDLLDFTQRWEKERIPRGTYTAEEVIKLYASLYKQAAVKNLPEQQELDELTIDWIGSNRPEKATQPHGELQLSDIEKQTLQTVQLPQEWFTAPERARSLHGQLHHARVAAFAAHVARQEGKNEKTASTVFVAGLLHDIRRVDDKVDELHGVRSADWVRDNYKEISETLGEVAKDIEWDRVIDAIAHHEQPSSDKETEDTSLLKTADALDRYRLPKTKWWISDEFLRIVPSDATKSLAFDTVLNSEYAFISSGDTYRAMNAIIGKE